jgi:K+-sensing histidine kinase KdpD
MGQVIETLSPSHLYQLSSIVSRSDNLKPALDEISRLLRKILIFDNLAVYILDSQNHLNAVYGKSVGRGRAAGADAAWGEMIANQIIENCGLLLDTPPPQEGSTRLERPYYLGIPLMHINKCLGAVVLIRFGSPPFNQPDCDMASFVAQQLSILVYRQHLKQEFEMLQGQRQQIQTREDFISNISHELRTPLGGIKGYTTTLLRDDITWDKATEQEFLQIIDKEADFLQQLIDNLLDSTRLSSGLLKMNLHSVRIDGVIKDAVARILLSHPAISIKLDNPDSLEAIDADALRLNQVFVNIFNNAIKYAPDTGIWVKIKQDQHNTYVSIQDLGPGIPAQYLPYIFDRFFRNPEISPNIHGSGLGLFICQQIISAHQGQIKAESEVGKGTTFFVTLPNIQAQVE